MGANLLPDNVELCAAVASARLQVPLCPTFDSVVGKAGAPLARAAQVDEGAVIIGAAAPHNIFPLDWTLLKAHGSLTARSG